jgi:glutamate carboxypeptidase
MLGFVIEGVLERLAARRAPMIERLRRLVEVNSFTDHPEGGARVGEMLAADIAAIAGMTVEARPSSRYAPHLVAWSAAAAKGADGCTALVGHLDTVFPPGTFEGWSESGDIARGPGVLDMKGGLCVVLEALGALASAGLLSAIPVRLIIVSDEEVGSPEGRPLLQAELRGAAAALVFEAGRKADAVITARKGTGAVIATAAGKAAHAGNGHAQGANAIWALARFVDGAQQLTDYARGITVNVGKVSGGQGKNTVPDRAEALLDVRFERVADADATVARLREVAAAATAGIPGTSVTLEGGVARTPLERTPENVALYRAYAACARAEGLGDGEAPLIGGGSDASSTAAIGIASIDGLGPRGTGFHTREELIEVSTLLPKSAALARFLLSRAVR